jgi:spore coat protein U-like protein
LNFGAYEVFATAPNNNGVGSLTIDCNGAGNHSFSITLSTGHSQSYASRAMRSGGNHLNYNLYTSADRSVVWGDGTGGSQVITATKNKSATFGVFGQIPFGQDVAIGTYSDNITTTVNF